MNQAIITVMNKMETNPRGKCVLYWMEHSQRAIDNLALVAAIERANELGLPVVVFFALAPKSPHDNERMMTFMVEGLQDVSRRLRDQRIKFVVRKSAPHKGLLKLAEEVHPAEVFADDCHLREGRTWRSYVAERLKVRFSLVDADVIVPVRFIGEEQPGAATLRQKIHNVLSDFLVEIPSPKVKVPSDRMRISGLKVEGEDLKTILKGLSIDRSVSPSRFYRGGTTEALRRLKDFLDERLDGYARRRDDFSREGTSNLSPYIRYGQISVHRIALVARGFPKSKGDRFAFLDQLITNRELAENFCFYNANYDSPEGFPEWGLLSLRKHAYDRRPHTYNLSQFENAETHDRLWNAAQRQLLITGKMHGHLRMLWAKKILEWTESAEEALKTAIYLNDRYAIDGRSPNGYANIARSIAGKHDRPQPERPIFGKIRYMSTEAACRKYDCKRFFKQIEKLAESEGQRIRPTKRNRRKKRPGR